MKSINIKCPNCNAQLTVSEDRKELYCEYCGTKLIIEDEVVKSVTIIRDEAKLKELAIEQEKREYREAEIKRLQEKSKLKKGDFIMFSICGILTILTIIVHVCSIPIVKYVASIMLVSWGAAIIRLMFLASASSDLSMLKIEHMYESHKNRDNNH